MPGFVLTGLRAQAPFIGHISRGQLKSATAFLESVSWCSAFIPTYQCPLKRSSHWPAITGECSVRSICSKEWMFDNMATASGTEACAIRSNSWEWGVGFSPVLMSPSSTLGVCAWRAGQQGKVIGTYLLSSRCKLSWHLGSQLQS
jgi:hypothetical protein